MTEKDTLGPQGPATLSGTGPVAPSGQSIGELVAKITAQFSALVRDEISYTKLQATAKVKKLGIGGALFAVAGVLALYMLGTLLLAAGFGFATIMPVWAAFLAVSGILLLIILLLALIGALSFKASKKHDVDPKSGLQKDIDAVKKGIK
ncbi:phage holin family protein [Trueperella pyogenes]|uniref:Phage holin family protein n=1 Tax=Trueperella pyogenes TaxID=1661 RepID=A0ABV3NAL2_9ACTO|nr:phage holin family protein [Trueperella pyogenes]MCI7690717.1 phage holin family protein [Trueperella pyogenes]MDF2419314.1 phage holin family protein [Trueperella pyogenes]UVJ53997.1 phage holin family protein [Trueperella pyogenes]WHU58709.1 phage holin family protein [Trueperella pyogenes]WHU60743.1 phage holin family protein [Trueperella pyogenes]